MNIESTNLVQSLIKLTVKLQILSQRFSLVKLFFRNKAFNFFAYPKLIYLKYNFNNYFIIDVLIDAL